MGMVNFRQQRRRSPWIAMRGHRVVLHHSRSRSRSSSRNRSEYRMGLRKSDPSLKEYDQVDVYTMICAAMGRMLVSNATTTEDDHPAAIPTEEAPLIIDNFVSVVSSMIRGEPEESVRWTCCSCFEDRVAYASDYIKFGCLVCYHRSSTCLKCEQSVREGTDWGVRSGKERHQSSNKLLVKRWDCCKCQRRRLACAKRRVAPSCVGCNHKVCPQCEKSMTHDGRMQVIEEVD